MKLNKTELALLDTFAAAAPPAPTWFQPKSEYVPKPSARELAFKHGLSESEFHSWQDGCDIEHENADALIQEYKEKYEKHKKWVAEQPILTAAQWPYHYARLLINERRRIHQQNDQEDQIQDAPPVV